jgi:hypothetical protein
MKKKHQEQEVQGPREGSKMWPFGWLLTYSKAMVAFPLVAAPADVPAAAE